MNLARLPTVIDSPTSPGHGRICRAPMRALGRSRRGMTLAELLAVSAILIMVAGAMGALAIGVQESNEFNYSHGVALQHGQVNLQRIQRALNSATANQTFPGFLVFAESIGGQTYPETLVVWHPRGAAVDPNGLPKMNELLVYCPNPNVSNELWEITAPADSRTAPQPSDLASWRNELDYLKRANTVQRVVLTDLLRRARPTDLSGNSLAARGVIRFEAKVRPSDAEWAQFLANSRTWDELSWVQGIHGTRTGLRQSWCRIEFQLRPGNTTDNNREIAIPFFGSGSVMYELQKP